jgi:putative FmdB family regulatory protein
VPTYQYACTDCAHAFEKHQSFSEDALTTCPECQGRLRKIFNAVGVVFKGSGFYRTDSRSDSSKSASTSSSSGSSNESKSASTSESTSGSTSGSATSSSTTSTAGAA